MAASWPSTTDQRRPQAGRTDRKPEAGGRSRHSRSARIRLGERVLVLLVGLGLLGPGRGLAEDRWTEPAPGIRHLTRTSSDPLLRLHAVLVDLTRPELRIRATPPTAQKRTVVEFASASGALVAINGNYQSRTQLCGIAMGDGQLWDTEYSYQADCASALGFSREDNRGLVFDSLDVSTRPADWITEVVAGKPALVRQGQPVAFACAGGDRLPLHCDPYARTAVGLTGDGQTLVMVVVDDQAGVSEGMNCPQLADLLRELGVHDGFALEYAGASSLYIRGEGVDGLVNCPSDGQCTPRPVQNHLSVEYTAGLRWYGAALAEQAADPPQPLAPGQLIERVVRYTNTGRRTWQAEGDAPVRLAPVAPREHASSLYDPGSWLSPTRAVGVERVTPAGEAGTFRVQLQAPGHGGSFTEQFAPVVELAEPIWLDEEPVSWTLRVEGPADEDQDGVTAATDCNDRDPRIHPGAPELCNGEDDDCTGVADDNLPPGRQIRIVWAAAAVATLRVNGQAVDRTATWESARVVPVQLRAGANVVAVEARRTAGRGGVLILLWLPDGEQIPSNTRWEAATQAEAGWDTPGGTNDGFTSATIAGYLGQPPWDRELQGLPEGLATEGWTWIWSSAPEADDQVYLRRTLIESPECDSGQPGRCQVGDWRCQAGSVRCVSRTQVGEHPETCNGLDDDCDGLIDETLAGCATAQDAGVLLPDLGPDVATGSLYVPPPREGTGQEAVQGGCNCQQQPGSSRPRTTWLLGLGLGLGLLLGR